MARTLRGIGGIVVFTEDITERKRAEAHYPAAQSRLLGPERINQTIVREKDSRPCFGRLPHRR